MLFSAPRCFWFTQEAIPPESVVFLYQTGTIALTDYGDMSDFEEHRGDSETKVTEASHLQIFPLHYWQNGLPGNA
jgi:hypothetical protein